MAEKKLFTMKVDGAFMERIRAEAARRRTSIADVLRQGAELMMAKAAPRKRDAEVQS